MNGKSRAAARGAGRRALWLGALIGVAGCAVDGGVGPAPDFAAPAFAEFNAFPATDRQLARGTFVYRVLNADESPHREITANVTGAFVDPATAKAWFVGLVESDVKICSGGGGSCDGHDDGTTHDDGGCTHDDGTTHDDGGCTHDDGTTHDDGGCTHDDGTTHDDGGCTHDDGATHDDGGCTHDDGTTNDDGGCTHDDGTTHDDGGCDGGGSEPGGGGHGSVPGKDPRVGQVVVLKMHDVATPGADGDGVTWKWFAPESWEWFEDVEGLRPALGPLAGEGADKAGPTEWPHLCKKTIIGGNLVVHLPNK
jgi:hypothetical protein